MGFALYGMKLEMPIMIGLVPALKTYPCNQSVLNYT